MTTRSSAGAGQKKIWRRFLGFWKWIANREDLPEAEEDPRPHRTGTSPLLWLISTSPLPFHADSSSEARSLSRWLASNEELPRRVDVSTRTRGFLEWLAGREELPPAPSREPVSKRSFVRWLLTPESPGRGREPQPTKEVAPHES